MGFKTRALVVLLKQYNLKRVFDFGLHVVSLSTFNNCETTVENECVSATLGNFGLDLIAKPLKTVGCRASEQTLHRTMFC